MKISFIVVWERRKPPHVPTSFNVIAALGIFGSFKVTLCVK